MAVSNYTGIIGIDPSFTHFGVYDGSAAHVIKTSPITDCSEEHSVIVRTEYLISELEKITDKIASEVQLWYIEAPMMNVPSHGGSHLYQLGYLMCKLHEYVRDVSSRGMPTAILQVDKQTILKTLFGKGRIPKPNLANVAFEKYGVRFERDAGLDKLHAWFLWRFGVGCLDGEWSHYAPARRSKPKQRAIQLLND